MEHSCVQRQVPLWGQQLQLEVTLQDGFSTVDERQLPVGVGLFVHPKADTPNATCQIHSTPSPGSKLMLAIGQSETLSKM